ncbi:hypothetical protein M527_06520 [Sphingobium indicum IP26]|uniref:Uncharacterized protein n=1 Tax=Sphingobium indicum F2 TaxID=1450518 RepID=A0A8E0WUT2_9SPHN|nr:hypothetical protein [Sphingobium indicum]EPR09777.1 hypothetical protein M527_06520 [Sphingobium indicum IP26]KER37273.1 hypothetical protein AL00_06265 [Sphingobium indicum F2]
MTLLDFNHGATKSREAVPTVDLMNSAAQALAKQQQPRNYLGGSRLGEACLRKLQYEYEGAPASRQATAKQHIIFAAGHALEDEAAKLLRAAGFDLRTHKADGNQFGFSVAAGRIRGHIDGVICGGPSEYGPYPFLWEQKWVANKYWQAIVKRGVAVERPTYASQVAIYQAYMDLTDNAALFSFGNRDTGELAFERLPFDAKRAQEASDNGVAVITATEAGERLPRPYPDADFFSCRMCDFSAHCWSEDR